MLYVIVDTERQDKVFLVKAVDLGAFEQKITVEHPYVIAGVFTEEEVSKLIELDFQIIMT